MLEVAGSPVGHHVGEPHSVVAPRVVHRQVEPLDVDHRIDGVAADLLRGGQASPGEQIAEAFAAGDPREERKDRLHVSPR